MTAGYRAEHDELRQLVRGFLREKSPGREVRRLMEADRNRDDAVWAQMAEQLGLPGMGRPPGSAPGWRRWPGSERPR